MPLSHHAPPFPTDSSNSSYPHYHKSPWWKIVLDIFLTLGTLGAFGAAGYYAHVAKQTYDKIAIQTNAIQQELEGSIGAVLAIDFDAAWGDHPYVFINAANRGRTDATDLHGSIIIDKISLPSEGLIGNPYAWGFDIPDLDYSTNTQATRGINIDISERELGAFKNLDEALKLSGTITYSNGFRTKSEPVCYYILGPLEFRNKAGVVATTMGGERSTCDGFDRVMVNLLKMKKDTASK